MRVALLSLLCAAAFAPEPQFVPVPQFVPIPRFADSPTAVVGSTEGAPTAFPLAPRADEPAMPPIPQERKVLRYERQCGPNGCETVPVYEESVDQAASQLQNWRALPEAEAKRLSAIVDGPAIAKALRQEYDIASCGMVCASHGSKLYDVFEDGTVKLAMEQSAAGESQGRSRVRIFGRRR
jgi:hypothetical protein